jgi:hypothetical protein
MEEVLPSDFLRVLRLSRKSSTDLINALTADDQNTAPRQRSPEHIRKIIETILWHRKFVLTYYLVLLALVAVICGLRICAAIKRRRSWRQEGSEKSQCTTTTSSSSSSTLLGTDTPPQKQRDTENTPLLGQGGCVTDRRPTLYRRLKAMLMYQPRPTKALTARVNLLPENGTTFLTLLFLALNIF